MVAVPFVRVSAMLSFLESSLSAISSRLRHFRSYGFQASLRMNLSQVAATASAGCDLIEHTTDVVVYPGLCSSEALHAGLAC